MGHLYNKAMECVKKQKTVKKKVINKLVCCMLFKLRTQKHANIIKKHKRQANTSNANKNAKKHAINVKEAEAETRIGLRGLLSCING